MKTRRCNALAVITLVLACAFVTKAQEARTFVGKVAGGGRAFQFNHERICKLGTQLAVHERILTNQLLGLNC
jgi:hypothetical protein